MKMLCIRGRQHPAHTGLTAGQVYDVEHVTVCHAPRAVASGVAFKRNVWLVCPVCTDFMRYPSGSLVPWGRDRFVPWQSPFVSTKEVRELYTPTDIREKQT